MGTISFSLGTPVNRSNLCMYLYLHLEIPWIEDRGSLRGIVLHRYIASVHTLLSRWNRVSNDDVASLTASTWNSYTSRDAEIDLQCREESAECRIMMWRDQGLPSWNSPSWNTWCLMRSICGALISDSPTIAKTAITRFHSLRPKC